MSHKIYPMTAEGKAKLEKKLNFLRLKKRPQVIKRIKVALSYGDLSENTEYTSAKNEQGLLESQIRTVETMLQYSKVIDNAGNDGLVDVGSTVTFEVMPNGPKMTYEIVGQSESDPSNHKISNDAPISKALMRHGVNNVVTAKLPKKHVKLKILKVA